MRAAVAVAVAVGYFLRLTGRFLFAGPRVSSCSLVVSSLKT